MTTTDELTALPINTLTDGDSHQLADALRSINHTLVAKNLPADKVTEIAEQLQCSSRTVRRRVELIRRAWLESENDPD